MVNDDIVCKNKTNQEYNIIKCLFKQFDLHDNTMFEVII